METAITILGYGMLATFTLVGVGATLGLILKGIDAAMREE